MTRVPVAYSSAYNAGANAITTRKSAWIAASLAADGTPGPIPGVSLFEPRPATEADLLEVHSPAYIQALRSGEPSALAESAGVGWTSDLWASLTASTGGLLAAAALATPTQPAGSLSSGLHHARGDHGSGFCSVNGLALAAKRHRERTGQVVAILDLDAHCGGGTASLIRRLDGVLQMDVAVSRFDAYADTANARLMLVDSAEDYLGAVRAALEGLPSDTGLVLHNAGMDPYEKDPVGGVAGVGREMLRERERLVFTWGREHGVPIAFALAGGYLGAGGSETVVDLHRLTLQAAADAARGFLRCEPE